MQVLDNGNKSIGEMVLFLDSVWPVLCNKEQSSHLDEFYISDANNFFQQAAKV